MFHKQLYEIIYKHNYINWSVTDKAIQTISNIVRSSNRFLFAELFTLRESR